MTAARGRPQDDDASAGSGRLVSADDAIAIYEPLLADRERILGAEHPDTLITRHNLAAQRGARTMLDGYWDGLSRARHDTLLVSAPPESR